MWPREDEVGVITPPEETKIIRVAYDECRVFTSSESFGAFPDQLPGGLTHFDRLTSTVMGGWLMRFSAIQASRIADIEEMMSDDSSAIEPELARTWIRMLTESAAEARQLKSVIPFKVEKSHKLVEQKRPRG